MSPLVLSFSNPVLILSEISNCFMFYIVHAFHLFDSDPASLPALASFHSSDNLVHQIMDYTV